MMSKKLTKEEIVERARKVHGDKYDYSEFLKDEFVYKDTHQNIPIICHEKCFNGEEHGIFKHDVNHHVYRKQGCPICSNKRYDLSKLIHLGQKKYKDKYTYENTKYSSDTSNDIIVNCKKHGEFITTPGKFLNGSGCPKCSKPRLIQEEEIAKFKDIHGDKYIYDKVNIKRAIDRIIVTCPIHGDFSTTPNGHKNGYGCPECAKEHLGDSNRMSWDEFVDKATKVFNGFYTYRPQEYKNNKTDIIATCPIHGNFKVRPDHHLSGKGCSACNESKLEREIRIFLMDNNISFEYRKKNFNWLNGLELDFYLPKYNVAIECQGGQHFNMIEFFNKRENFTHRQKIDKIKKQLCEENGVKLLYYSNLGIEYPYEVFEDKEKLLKEILNNKENE